MVTGLKSFQEWFKGYEQQYTINKIADKLEISSSMGNGIKVALSGNMRASMRRVKSSIINGYLGFLE